MLREIKAIIRANSEWLEMWKNGEISYGKMAQELSKQILNHTLYLGMLPPHTVKSVVKDGWDLEKGAPGKIIVECSRLEWDEE